MRTPSRILVVDDDPMNVDILKTCLAAHGYDMVTASDGEAGLALAREQCPDLILLDVMMPKRDGIDVCRSIKDDRSLPFMPIILITARADSHDVIAGLEAGADEYLTKPVDQAALVARVRSMLRIKELHDKLQDQAAQLEAQASQLAAWNQELKAQLFEEAKLAEIARLLGDIGHDVKNMMMPILMGADLLQSDLEELLRALPPAQERQAKATHELSHDVFEMVQNNARRVQDRVKEIADAVKGRSGPPNLTSCCISKVVAPVFEALRFFAEQHRVALSAHNLEHLPLIQADESRLFNAFYNLINNAIPETPAGGSIVVDGRLEPDSNVVVLSVTDNGRGMSPEVRDSLFTKRVISRKTGGTGLGTKIVKDAVDAHGGSITVESEPGKGTRFLLRLPVAPPMACAADSAESEKDGQFVPSHLR